MATIKSYSDLQQSKKLANILPLESADMIYVGDDAYIGSIETVKNKYGIMFIFNKECIPCWSLTALLCVLPYIDFTTPQLVGTPKTLYRCMYNDDLKSHAYDNPVDACYEMIIRLNELKML